ncbi:MAG: glycosyl hydrolase family 65 protein [Bacteroidota bacterium]
MSSIRLTDTLSAKDGWILAEDSYSPRSIDLGRDCLFMVGNGYLGYRGTLAEARAEQGVSCIVSDTFNCADGQWTELCNVPNALFLSLRVNVEEISAFQSSIHAHQRSMDLQDGIFHRDGSYQSEQGHIIQIEEERFASYYDLHLLASQVRITSDKEVQLEVITGIDMLVSDLHGPHLKDCQTRQEKGIIAMEARTSQSDIRIAIAEGIVVEGAEAISNDIVQREDGIYRVYAFKLTAGQPLIIEKLVSIYHSNDTARLAERPRYQGTRDPLVAVFQDVEDCLDSGYLYAKQVHQEQWKRSWESCDIQLEGDPELQFALRFCLFHNLIATPLHGPLPIAARGLSSQAYQGGAFWDQEIFNLPMLLHTQPRMARNLLEYRYRTLPAARKKAQRLGYKGAYFAWISGKQGEELCPDFYYWDVYADRPTRNHLNDWQIHISLDVAFAVCQYVEATGDTRFWLEGGAEILFEVARFIYSFAYFNPGKKRYELLCVIGPDEYHEGVNNNAYTNYLAHDILTKALLLQEDLRKRETEFLHQLEERLGLSSEEIKAWRHMRDALFRALPNEETAVIPQFDGYERLRDTTPAQLQQEVSSPEEYWGYPAGIAVNTQVIKQADVVQLLCMHKGFSQEVLLANLNYYAPRTEHASSLSPSAYARLATRVGEMEMAYRYTHRSLTMDLYQKQRPSSGGVFIGGIHTAACGAAWQVMVFGFAGINVLEDGIELAPCLPEKWSSLSFAFRIQGQLLKIQITPDTLIVSASLLNLNKVRVRCGEKEIWLNADEKGEWPIMTSPG